MQVVEQISLCVVVRDQVAQIEEFFESVFVAADGSSLSEVVLVDIGSVDGTAERAQAWLSSHMRESLSYKILRLNQNHRGLACATAVSVCTQNWVAFLDADCRPEKNWFSRILKTAQTCPMQSTLAAVGGKTIAVADEQTGISRGFAKVSNLFWALFRRNRFSKPEYLRTVSHAAGCNILYRKDALLKVGNFSTKLLEAGEDLEMTARFMQRGFQIWSDPEAIVYQNAWHGHREWFGSVYRAARWQWVVVQKYPAVLGLRHLAAMVLPVLLLTGFVFNWKAAVLFIGALFFAGFILAALASGRQAWRVSTVWILSGLSYSLGFYRGLLQWFVFGENLNPSVQDLQASRNYFSR